MAQQTVRTRPYRRMTMKDVAKAAGVGLGTVSRVFSGSEQVATETRQRVLETARRLDYRPSALGRGLKLQRTNNIGLIVADVSSSFCGELAEGLLTAARALGKHVIVCPTGGDPGAEREFTEVLLQQHVDGIVAIPTGENMDAWDGALRLGVRVVFIDRMVDGIAVPTLVADNVGGSRSAVEYLLALGHHRIGYLGGPLSLTSGCQREEGYRLAHQLADVPVCEDLVVRTPFSRDTAHASVLRLLQGAQAPTALFAANNVLAEAALSAVLDSGLRVPDDISLAMFDDVPWARVTRPAITVVSQPARQMGEQAAGIIAAPGPVGGQVRVLPTRFIIRQSCGPLAVTMEPAAI
jgi:LacI family transcriptional regulator